jgi:hypothetical protein
MVLIDQFVQPSKPRTQYRPVLSPTIRPPSRPPVQPIVRVQYKKTFEAPKRQTGWVKLALQVVAITLLAMVLGLAASSQTIGMVAIGVYAIVAVALRFSSRTTFALALIAFGMIMLLEIMLPTSGLSANFAVYAFLLLVVGTLSVGLEVHQETIWKKRRQNPRK